MMVSKIIVLLMFAIMLNSCAPADTASPTTTQTPGATQTPRATLTATTTQAATATQRPLPSRRPSPTPTITPTYTPTAPDLPTFLDVPEWLGDPEINVLMFLTRNPEGSYQLSFFNANTGDRFDLPDNFLANIGYYFWMPDGRSFGLVSQNRQEIYLIDIMSGEITAREAGINTTRFLSTGNSYPYMAFTSGLSFDGDNFILPVSRVFYDSRFGAFSNNGLYFVQIDVEEYRFTKIENLLTGEIIQITNPDDEYYDVYFEWSPVSNQLAILHRSVPPFHTDYGFEIDNDDIEFKVNIYDPATGRILGSYKDVGDARWSPDGTQILYDEQGRYFWSIREDYSSAPCIFTIITGETNCLNYIRNWHGQISLRDYIWSPDGTRLSYTYEYDILYPDFYIDTGGLCIVDLLSRGIICPTDLMPELDIYKGFHLHALGHSWSPDSNFIAFTTGMCKYYCDESIEELIYIISSDGGQYYYLDKRVYNYSLTDAWRPPITD
ncbi:MAG: hypothetical protein FVQ83_12340 [Chloroflexi bacterium]|nr:hypothetical protein [Chloroflexota bacterium]